MSTFNPPVKSQLTPHAEINNFIKNTEEYLTGLSTDLNTAFAEVPQMSETPQRIGTWIDGSPIFRMAFDVLLKDMDAEAYAAILSDSAFFVPTLSGSVVAYPIYAFCMYNWDNKANICPIGGMIDNIIDFEIPFGAPVPEDQSDCTDERYCGYIDFIQTGDAE